MNRGMLALIRKDLRSVTANHRMLVTLLVVPLVLTVFLPTVAVVTLHTAPEEAADFQKLLALLPVAAGGEGMERQILNLLLNYVLPLFFLIIPVMTASVMASASFVGEREKHTLETLLYGPLSLRQVFRAKVLAAFTLSMGVSLLSFGIMLAVFEGEVLWLTGQLLAPAPAWLLVLLLGQQAQGEQVKVVQGGQAAGAFGVLGHGKHLLALVRASIVPQRRGFA